MCGLVGMVTKSRHGFTSRDMDVFDHLLFMDQLRGPDSTGVFLVNNLGNVNIIKESSHASNFMRDPAYRTIRQDAVSNGWAIIGHNRKATRGVINDENAHPFWVEDKVVLVHNGTMYGDHKHHADVEVDSHAIAHILAEEPDAEKAMQKINAAYALIWYKVKEKSLNFLRNDARPLHWCETQDAFIISSEQEILQFACDRVGVRILNNGPFQFDVHQHDVWTLNDNRSTNFETLKLDAKYRQPVVEQPAPAASVLNFPGGRQADTTINQQLHRLANGYWPGYGGVDDEDEQHLAEIREAGKKVAEQATIIKEESPSWAKKHSYTQYLVSKDAYQSGTKIRVECKNYLDTDAGPNMVYLTGRTMDANEFYCVFPVPVQTFEFITAPHSDEAKANRAIFSVEIDVCGWKRYKESRGMDQGVITLTGKNPRLVVVPEVLH